MPLSWLFCLAALSRRRAYLSGLRRQHPFPVPIVIVGNLTVGGTGKTPLVIWIVELLRQAGYSPGIVSRGYGGLGARRPLLVEPTADPEQVGDEPLLIARRTGRPVVVARDRVAAVRTLLQQHACDAVVSDDGLQHYRLGRSVEIAVIDAARRLGNRRCLPAGPLREPPGRLRSVDAVVVHGAGPADEWGMAYRFLEPLPVRLGGEVRRLEDLRGWTVHAVAGIGDPVRFFDALRAKGIDVIEHPFPDHHRYVADEIRFPDSLPVLMTEKDAVKCAAIAGPQHGYLPICAELSPGFAERVLGLLRGRNDGQTTA